jgi:hypothetical protein
MLTAVHFDNQTSGDAAEIDAVSAYRMLAAEFERRQALCSQVRRCLRSRAVDSARS